ncbi:MAG: hypothetical protein AAGA60_11245 [Cyanobacteria bacterium P01_E01_bin.42]
MIFLTDRPDNPNFTVLKQAILSHSPQTSIQILSPDAIAPTTEAIYPLTFNVPQTLEFAAKSIYQQCQNVEVLRRWVEQNLEYATGEGNYWLPIVLTAKGPLYAEAIAWNDNTQTYEQPFHLSDVLRQPLYHLAWDLLSYLEAPPAVYTLQFNWQGEEIFFDRLFPFPHASTHISLGIQQPDLLTCHGLCITQQPILDLAIVPHSFQ